MLWHAFDWIAIMVGSPICMHLCVCAYANLWLPSASKRQSAEAPQKCIYLIWMREMAIYLVARALICIHNWFACIFTHTYMHKRSYWRSYWPLCCKEAKRECVLMCRQHNGTTQRWAVPTTKRASQKPEKCEQRRRRSGQLASVNSFGCTQEEWRAANKEVRKSTFIFHAANAFVVVVATAALQCDAVGHSTFALQCCRLLLLQFDVATNAEYDDCK